MRIWKTKLTVQEQTLLKKYSEMDLLKRIYLKHNKFSGIPEYNKLYRKYLVPNWNRNMSSPMAYGFDKEDYLKNLAVICRIVKKLKEDGVKC